MTCPNQLELGEKTEKAQKKLTDESTKEGPHSVGVWTLKTIYSDNKLYFIIWWIVLERFYE